MPDRLRQGKTRVGLTQERSLTAGRGTSQMRINRLGYV